MFFLLSTEFLLKINFFQKFSQEYLSVSNNLDPDQAQHHVGPDLGRICFQSYQETLAGKRVNLLSKSICTYN